MKRGLLLFLLMLVSVALVSCQQKTPEKEENPDEEETPVQEDFSSVEYDKILKLYFNSAGQVGSQINPFIYGTFIEHMERIIYDGLWAEEIMDRKFVCPIGEDVSQWKKGSDKLITSDSENTYSGGYAPHFIEGASIMQRGIVLHDDLYNGYFYALGQGRVKVILQATTNETVVQIIDIDSKDAFSKYEFQISTPVEGKYSLTYVSEAGDFYLDSVSLMKADNIYGMRKDTLDLLKELNAPFYRWPGGNFVSGYDFYDGIGPRDQRKTKRNLHYARSLDSFKNDADRLAADLVRIDNQGFYAIYEPNDFGIDEFIQMCRYLDAIPNIVLNAGLGTVEMAKDEVQYINGTSGHYASLRPQKEPYNVTYFSIGNEMNGTWQLGHMPLEDYTIKHNQIAEAIKEISPNIKIIAVGDNVSSWTQTMVNSCASNMDYTSEHFYATREEESVQKHILSLKEQAQWRIREHRNLKGADQIMMAIDEYAYSEAIISSRLKDGMGVASCLNEFIKNADVVKIACYSSTINAVQGQIKTDDLNAYLEGSGMINALYSRYMQGYNLNITYNIKDFNEYIEVCATINLERNKITVSVINTTDLRLKINNSNIKNIISRSYMTSDSFEGINNSEGQELRIVREDTSLNRCLVEPRSVTIIEFEI